MAWYIKVTKVSDIGTGGTFEISFDTIEKVDNEIVQSWSDTANFGTDATVQGIRDGLISIATRQYKETYTIVNQVREFIDLEIEVK